MVQYKDVSLPVTISVLGQGVAHISSYTLSKQYANPNETITINVSIQNNSNNVDDLYCEYWINSTHNTAWDETLLSVPANSSPIALTPRAYIMPVTDNNLIEVRVGHMVGGTKSPADETQPKYVYLWARAELLNVGTNSPVEEGGTAIIMFDIHNINTARGGNFWAGLFNDDQGTSPYVGATGTGIFASMPFTAGETKIDFEIDIPNALPPQITAYLVIGHVE